MHHDRCFDGFMGIIVLHASICFVESTMAEESSKFGNAGAPTFLQPWPLFESKATLH
jgi:hypothetical protein